MGAQVVLPVKDESDALFVIVNVVTSFEIEPVKENPPTCINV